MRDYSENFECHIENFAIEPITCSVACGWKECCWFKEQFGKKKSDSFVRDIGKTKNHLVWAVINNDFKNGGQ